MKKLPWLWCILLLVASSATPQTETVPFQIGTHNSIILHVKVNGYAATMLLDTGASLSIVSPRIGGNLATMQTASIEEGHTTQTIHIAHGTLNFGKGERDTAFVVTDLNPNQASAIGVKQLDGIIGMQDLAQFKTVHLDFKHRTLTLE